MFLIQDHTLQKRNSLLQNNKLLDKIYRHQHPLSNYLKPQHPINTPIAFHFTQSRTTQCINYNKETKSYRQVAANQRSPNTSVPAKINNSIINNEEFLKNVGCQRNRRTEVGSGVPYQQISQRTQDRSNNLSAAICKRRKLLQKKMAFSPAMDKFYSPFVDVVIVDKVKRLKDVSEQSIRMKFETIYRKLISHQLNGQITADFMCVLERIIRQIVGDGELYLNPFEIELQPYLKAYSKKQELIEAIDRLQSSQQFSKIKQLVKYYCVPQKQMCQTILHQLIDHLVVEIYQNKNCRRDIDYVLLNQDGSIIHHISQIFFSTVQLYIAPKHSAHKSYHRFKMLVAEDNVDSRVCFNQVVKNNFVNLIVRNQIENKVINYEPNVIQSQRTRKSMFEHAQTILSSKSKARIKTKRQKQKQDVEEGSKSMVFYKVKGLETHGNDLYVNYISRKRKERLQYAGIMERLQQILDPHKKFTINNRAEENTRKQFKRLYDFNQNFDITYNHLNHDKILLANAIENCVLFNTKSHEQMSKIKKLLSKVYRGGQSLKELCYEQFKEVFETAHGVSSRENIVKLVLNYFDFNEFGELSKAQFESEIDTCLSLYGRSMQIIKYILWNYLQKHKIAGGSVILKKKMQLDFEQHRIVFLLLVSIIFGTEYCSVQDMLNAILCNQDN